MVSIYELFCVLFKLFMNKFENKTLLKYYCIFTVAVYFNQGRLPRPDWGGYFQIFQKISLNCDLNFKMWVDVIIWSSLSSLTNHYNEHVLD